MKEKNNYDVIIIGGSYSGMAAAMPLGRAMRKILIVDSGLPCNRQTPFSHNFLTQDGKKPHEISAIAKEQVLKYPTVEFSSDWVMDVQKRGNEFEVLTKNNNTFLASKLIFATGIKDILPGIKGFAECWGISVLHCPYCHGYEVRNQKTGIFGKGDELVEFSKLIYNWTKDITIFTNGKSNFTATQIKALQKNNIAIVETEMAALEHINGQIQTIVFKDHSTLEIKTLYAKIPFEQHCTIPDTLGCKINQEGYYQMENNYKTNIQGLFVCGDNASRMRTLANAVAMGTSVGMMVNKELAEEIFAG